MHYIFVQNLLIQDHFKRTFPFLLRLDFFDGSGYDLTIEYYRVDIWGFFKRPELEMVK